MYILFYKVWKLGQILSNMTGVASSKTSSNKHNQKLECFDVPIIYTKQEYRLRRAVYTWKWLY